MIYLDNNATTFLDPVVAQAVQSVLRGKYGNPSSLHKYGQAAKALLVQASKQIAAFFGVSEEEVNFTSGATEALNMLVKAAPSGKHIITSSLEHAAVLEPLKRSGCPVTYLDPLPLIGAVTPKQVKEALTPNTSMIFLMAANNETGVKTDIEAIAELALEANIPLIVDGVSILGKETWKVPQGVTAVCFSGHKIHAPVGVGCLIIRKQFKPKPLIVGGGQQKGLRGGTENVAGIVGFAAGLACIREKISGDIARMRSLRDRFEEGILNKLPDVVIHGFDQPRLCNTSNIAFLGVEGETLLMVLDLAGVAASHGSACSSGALEPTRVLLNMGVTTSVARSSIRFSLSRFTTQEEIDKALEIVVDAVGRLRSFSYSLD